MNLFWSFPCESIGLAAVAQNVPEWTPTPSESEDSVLDAEIAAGKMRFADFDLDRMIAQVEKMQ